MTRGDSMQPSETKYQAKDMNHNNSIQTVNYNF